MLKNALVLFVGCITVHSLSVSGPNHDDEDYFSPNSIVGLHGMTNESPHHHNYKNKAKMNVDQVLVSESGHSNAYSKQRLFNSDSPRSISKNNEHNSESVKTQIHHGYGSGAGNTRSEGSADLVNVLNTQGNHHKVSKPGRQIEEAESFTHVDAYGGSEGSNFDKMRFNHGSLDYWSDGSDWGKVQDQGNKHKVERDSHHSQYNQGVSHYDTAVTCTCSNGVARRADCMKDKPEWCESCNAGQPVRLIIQGLVQAFCGWNENGLYVDPTLQNMFNLTDVEVVDMDLPSRGPIAVSSLPDIGHHEAGHTSEYSGQSYHGHTHLYYTTAHNASDHTHYYY